MHAVQAHTSKTGDGTVAMLAMITAGLQKASDRCGDNGVGGGGGAMGERRVNLAAGLAALNREALPATLFRVLASAALKVPVPIQAPTQPPSPVISGTSGEGNDVDEQEAEESFRAGVRAVAATMFAGAVAPAAAKKLTVGRCRLIPV